MPLNEFWHGDMRLLTVYQKAYYRDKQYSAWWNGQYVQVGVYNAVFNNINAKTESDLKTYPKYEDFTEKLYARAEPKKITKENIEEEFRQEQLRQQQWVRNLLEK